MKIPFIKSVLFILPALLAAACGSDSSNIAIANIGTEVKDALCNRAVACGTLPDNATCQAAILEDAGQLIADVSSGKVKYDGAAAASCIDFLENSSCSASDTYNLAQPSSCTAAFTGTVADGGACVIDEDCISQSCTTNSSCTGTCNPTVAKVASGGDCSANASACPDGTYCKAPTGAATTSICTPFTAAGQPCTELGECAVGTICDFDSTAQTAVCERLPGEGDACSITKLGCDLSADYCDPTSLKCVKRLTVGAACPQGNECAQFDGCDNTTHTCVALVGAGGACSGTGSGNCLGNLECTSGTCQLPAPAAICQ